MGSLRRVGADNDPQLARALIARRRWYEVGVTRWVSPALSWMTGSGAVMVAWSRAIA